MQREPFHTIVTISRIVVICLAMMAWTATPAMADQKNWDGVGDWTDNAANWTTGSVPTSSTLTNLRSGTVSINNEDVATQYLWFGHDFGGTAANMTLNMSGGSLTTGLEAAFLGLNSPKFFAWVMDCS